VSGDPDAIEAGSLLWLETWPLITTIKVVPCTVIDLIRDEGRVDQIICRREDTGESFFATAFYGKINHMEAVIGPCLVWGTAHRSVLVDDGHGPYGIQRVTDCPPREFQGPDAL
jgi:hypothetical protein